MCAHKLNTAVEEEIGHLPEKYRAPVVLCYLEGIMATAALLAGLMTAGAGMIGNSALGEENPPRAGTPGQDARQPVSPASVTQAPPRPAAAKSATDQGPPTIQVEVVDPKGRSVSGADVVMRIWYWHGSESAEPVLGRTRTDGGGHTRVEVAREHLGATVRFARVWAYQPGRALATSNVLLMGKTPPSATQLTLNEPGKWTVTILGPEEWSMAGLRLTPHSFRQTDRRTASPTVLEASLDELLTVTTDAKGMATLVGVPGNMAPLSIRVVGPGVASHILPVDVPRGNDVVVRLGRPGRVVGIVRTASGAPLADAPVELWVQGSGTLPRNFSIRGDERITDNAIIGLGPEPVKTGPQGAFQTSSTLLGGSTYRVSVRQDGFVPFVSGWVTLNGERAVIPDIRLQPLEQLTGRIIDRQSSPVAGARVYVPAGNPRAVTDAQERFTLAGINPARTIILVEQNGFRLQGWLVGSSTRAQVGPLTLVRVNETPDLVMKPLAEPIPLAESRALANRLLQPYLPEPMENDNQESGLVAIAALSEFDLSRALELFGNGNFRAEDRAYQSIRGSLAAKLAAKDPARSEAMVEPVIDPLLKVDALISVAKALAATERGRKQVMLERATVLIRDQLRQANSSRRLRDLSRIAEQWLDMGERDRGRRVLEIGKTSNKVFESAFLGQLGRLEPEWVIARLQQQPNTPGNPNVRNSSLAEIAVLLATDHPAVAERIFNLREETGDQNHAVFSELQLCRRLARVDPPRARRVAASLAGTGTRACAWASVAVGLAEKDKAGAREALDRAIREIDRLRESGPGPETVSTIGGIRLMLPTNPAAQILPVVERIAPERLAEVFWRAVALHPRIEENREDLLQSSYLGYECTLLARYDREIATALFEPMNSYLQSLSARKGALAASLSAAILAQGCIDPRGAVALVESLAPPGDVGRPNRPYKARLRLAEVLGLAPEDRWIRLWRSVGAQLDD